MKKINSIEDFNKRIKRILVTKEEIDEKIKEAVMGELKKAFRPEFLNRVDDIIVFRKLVKEDIKEISSKMLDISLQDHNQYHNAALMQLEIDNYRPYRNTNSLGLHDRHHGEHIVS